jgi:selenocysteine-specific elongation factor
MRSVIVGTAGHIDHGKTALVRALTGIDTDRLEEEKRRGITIDLGFAHLELDGQGGEKVRLGFVDVPGHERFVRNMLAGVGGIDVVVLVIAADEGIKPQTREHFDICRLLSVRSGITVLTKSDLVDRETLDVVRLEVAEFLRGSFLEAAPMVAVSAKTGAGLEELKRTLAEVATGVPVRDSNALPRLPIDRVFSMKGFGTVVTGTLVAGTIRKEDELEIFPTGKRARVRGVQVHGKAATAAVAGQRTALNLTGVTTEEVARGMMLAPEVLRSTARVDVWLNLLASARALKDRAQVHLHAYTMETVAEVVLLGEKQLAPGRNALARLQLTDAGLLLPGDRFIVRQFSPVITIGGGVVLDAAPTERRARAAGPFLERVKSDVDADVLLARIERRAQGGLDLATTVAETAWTRARVGLVVKELERAGHVIVCGEVAISSAAFGKAQEIVLRELEVFHKARPMEPGMGKEALREQAGMEAPGFEELLKRLMGAKKIEVAGEFVRLAGRGGVLKEEETESKRAIEEAFARAGLAVPALRDVLANVKVDRVRAQQIVTLLLRDKVLVKVSEELVFHRMALEDLRRRMGEFKAKSSKIDVGSFKELTGVTRKYAIPLLEYLDRERVTRRVGDERVIL